MDKVIPVIVICSVGIAVALGYIVYLTVQAILRKRGRRRNKRNEFEIEEDALIIKLGKRKK